MTVMEIICSVVPEKTTQTSVFAPAKRNGHRAPHTGTAEPKSPQGQVRYRWEQQHGKCLNGMHNLTVVKKRCVLYRSWCGCVQQRAMLLEDQIEWRQCEKRKDHHKICRRSSVQSLSQKWFGFVWFLSPIIDSLVVRMIILMMRLWSVPWRRRDWACL